MKKLVLIATIIGLALCFSSCEQDKTNELEDITVTVAVKKTAPDKSLKDEDDDPINPIGDIEGNIKNGSGDPVVNASVKLNSSSGSFTTRSTLTNSLGNYIFNDVPAGYYQLNVEINGILFESKSVTVQ